MNASVGARAMCRERGAQIREVGLHRGAIDELDRRYAARAFERLLAEHSPERFAQLRIRREIEVRRPRIMARESRQSVLDVGGVADLARLAVADDVDAGRDLLRHGVGHAGRDRGIERRTVVRLAAVFFVKQVDDLAAARKATHVSRQDPLGAESHYFSRRAPPEARDAVHIVSYGRVKNLQRLNLCTAVDAVANGMV